MQWIISKDLFHIIHALKYNIFDLFWLFIELKDALHTYRCKPSLVVVYVDIIMFEQPHGVAPTTIPNVFRTTLKCVPSRCNFVNPQNLQHLIFLMNENVHLF
jgi:hypothetical protein